MSYLVRQRQVRDLGASNHRTQRAVRHALQSADDPRVRGQAVIDEVERLGLEPTESAGPLPEILDEDVHVRAVVARLADQFYQVHACSGHRAHPRRVVFTLLFEDDAVAAGFVTQRAHVRAPDLLRCAG